MWHLFAGESARCGVANAPIDAAPAAILPQFRSAPQTAGWKNPETGEPVASCTIIVKDANALTRPIHNRMPVILVNADIKLWLNGSGAELLRSAAEDRVRLWPVSKRVNKAGNGDDDPTLVEEVTV